MKALCLLILSARVLSWTWALPDQITERSHLSLDGGTGDKSRLAMAAKIFTIIAATVQVAAILVGFRAR